ncbi:hypothetical protein Hypma_003798 [Hypsizygus marmoreus]|uniref:DUF7330 domain-containing protein n=1 Tax=Hypsizygus marmoreus TaxID=39966 RepID=A0A369K4L8_HYPMA|nr:hypothetical protein Hypma_003798 [Hypsizygus marmoreus]
MIIVPKDAKSAEAEAAPKAVGTPSDPPPTYTSETPPEASGPSSAPLISPQPAIKRSNYVSISRTNEAVKGTWYLDPALTIPAALLPPLVGDDTEDTRRNFNLQSSNGQIDADITIAPYDPSTDSKKLGRRTTMYARSSNGNIAVKVHDPKSPRRPIYINAYSSNGGVSVSLPRSFEGLIGIKTHNGSSKFSAETSAQLTTFSDVNKMRRCFIGDYSKMADNQEWTGDEVAVETYNGSVKLQYVDEVSEPGKGFFGRLFGL